MHRPWVGRSFSGQSPGIIKIMHRPILNSRTPAIKGSNKITYKEILMKRSLLFVFFVLITSLNSFACEDVGANKVKEYVSKELKISQDLLHVEMTELGSDQDWDWMHLKYEVEVKSSDGRAAVLAKLWMYITITRDENGAEVCEVELGNVLFITDKEEDCMNMDEYFEEDSLYINFSTLTGRYFDNDRYRELVCTVSDREEETIHKTLYCKGKGTDSDLLARIAPDGKAIVISDGDLWIDFQCTRD